MIKRKFNLHGYDINLYDFGYSQFLYPNFNGDAEFKVTKEGFKKLSSYLRSLIYFKKLINKHNTIIL